MCRRNEEEVVPTVGLPTTDNGREFQQITVQRKKDHLYMSLVIWRCLYDNVIECVFLVLIYYQWVLRCGLAAGTAIKQWTIL